MTAWPREAAPRFSGASTNFSFRESSDIKAAPFRVARGIARTSRFVERPTVSARAVPVLDYVSKPPFLAAPDGILAGPVECSIASAAVCRRIHYIERSGSALSINLERARRETPGCERVLHFNNAGASL